MKWLNSSITSIMADLSGLQSSRDRELRNPINIQLPTWMGEWYGLSYHRTCVHSMLCSNTQMLLELYYRTWQFMFQFKLKVFSITLTFMETYYMVSIGRFLCTTFEFYSPYFCRNNIKNRIEPPGVDKALNSKYMTKRQPYSFILLLLYFS